MKKAIKILSIVFMIIFILFFIGSIIFLLNCEGIVDYFYENNTLTVNGHPATLEDVQYLKIALRIVSIIIVVVFVLLNCLMIVNLAISNSKNSTIFIAFGIVEIILGIIPIGIVMLIYGANFDKYQET